MDETPRTPAYFDGYPTVNQRPALERWQPMDVLPASRLKLRPPQRMRNRYITDFIASLSTREREQPLAASAAVGGVRGGAGAGATTATTPPPTTTGREWAWSFDPAKDVKMLETDRFPDSVQKYLSVDFVASMRCRVAFVVGDESAIVNPRLLAYTCLVLGDRVPITTLRCCGHHVMVRASVRVRSLHRRADNDYEGDIQKKK
jgi:hypothetical protein